MVQSYLHEFISDLDVCKNKGCNEGKFGEIIKRRHKCNYDLKIVCNTLFKEDKPISILKDINDILKEEIVNNSTIKINTFWFEQNRLLFTFTRPSVTKALFYEISDKNASYGKTQVFKDKKFKIEYVKCKELVSLRMKKATDAISALVLAGGGFITDDESYDVEKVCLSYKHKTDKTILVGPVHTSRGAQVTEEDLIRLRTKDIQAMSEHKGLDEKSIRHLVEAALTFDMISVKLEKLLTLELSDEPKASRKTNCKGAPFVLYNFTRLSAILEKHDYFVAKQVYPPLPSLQDVNYDLLNSEDEWTLVYDLLAEWPQVVKECQDLNQPKLYRITSFLSALSSTFSVYYRHTRILNEGLAHMVPQMQARIHLLLTIKQVFSNALSLLNITTLRSM